MEVPEEVEFLEGVETPLDKFVGRPRIPCRLESRRFHDGKKARTPSTGEAGIPAGHNLSSCEKGVCLEGSEVGGKEGETGQAEWERLGGNSLGRLSLLGWFV